MITTEGNPFGNALVQPSYAASPPDAGRLLLQAQPSLAASGYTQKGVNLGEAPFQSLIGMFVNESGLGNFLNFLAGGKSTSTTAKPYSLNVEPFAGEDEAEPEVGLPLNIIAGRRATSYGGTKGIAPSLHSLDLVS